MIKTTGLNILQKISMSLMAVLVLITFVGANLQAVLWQSSSWLVSTVLPAVVVDLTNEERSDNSAQPLIRNITLDKAAQLKAQHMAENEYFSHHSPDGVSPWHWFDESGYVYAHAGENLAIHFTDSSEVVEAWMDSPTHRKNIVDSKFTEIGVGTAKGSYEGYDTVYVVQLFGAPAVIPTPPPVVEPEELVLATEPDLPVEIESVTEEPVVVIPEESNTLITEPDVEVLSQNAELALEVTEVAEVQEITEVIEQEITAPVVVSEVIEEPVFKNEELESTLYEEVLVTETDLSEVVVIESPVIATSSGLAVAQIDTTKVSHAGATMASIATQPSALLQILYSVLALAVVMMLGASIVMEAKKLRFEQVAYGLLLLIGMGGLWFVNSILTTGAVIV